MLDLKIKIPRLEIHLSHHCNLSCSDCSHLSNYKKVTGVLSVENFVSWNKSWSTKIYPQKYQMMGGEPTLNKSLPEMCELAREFWPNSDIALVTNGFYLYKHPTLPHVLETQRVRLIVSIHHTSIEYTYKLNEIRSLIETWQQSYQFSVDWRESYNNWQHLFKTNEKGEQIPANNNDIKSSFSKCGSSWAKQLFEGAIWKCPPLAYLHLIKQKYPMNPSWDEYLQYKGIEPTATYDKLLAFFEQAEEHWCNMCQANPQKYRKENPLIQLQIPKF